VRPRPPGEGSWRSQLAIFLPFASRSAYSPRAAARLSRQWGRISEAATRPRPSRGYVSGWGCPGDGCGGSFRSPERAAEHAVRSQARGTHDNRTAREVFRDRRQARGRSR
jgi:hypothetical protein